MIEILRAMRESTNEVVSGIVWFFLILPKAIFILGPPLIVGGLPMVFTIFFKIPEITINNFDIFLLFQVGWMFTIGFIFIVWWIKFTDKLAFIGEVK